MTKKPEFEAGPAPTTPPPSIELFLALVAAEGHVGRAAQKAGLTIEGVVRLERTDEAFKERFKDACAARRHLVADALYEEALGVEHKDPVNGVVRRTRNTTLLARLAEKHGVIDTAKPTAAVQINNTQQNLPPADVALINASRQRLRQLLSGKPAQQVLDATIVEPAAVSTDPDEDLL